MRGFVWFPVVLIGSIVFASLSLYINTNNLSGLLGAANDLAFKVSGLRVPYDIDYSVSKYADKKDYLYKESLRSAWENARLAVEASKDIQRIATGAKLTVKDNQTMVELDVSIYSREAEVRAYLEKALKDSYYTLQGLVNLLDSDKSDLDLMGADNPNFTKSQIFVSLDRFLGSINQETGHYNQVTVIEANPCSLDDLKYRSICIIRQMSLLQKPTVEQAVSIFNQIVGYPGPSLLHDYFEYHKELSSLMVEMQNNYDDSIRLFDQKLSEAGRKMDGLRDNGALLISSSVLNSISRLGGLFQISGGRSGSPQEQLILFEQDMRQIEERKYLADRVFEQKQDDYLFQSTEMIRSLNFELTDLSMALDGLSKSLSDLRDKAKALYDELIQKNSGKKTTALYLNALDYGERAQNERTIGQSVIDYSKAISFLMFIQNSENSTLTLDYNLDYLRKTLDSLHAFGVDTSYEQNEYERLAKIDDPSLSSEIFLSTQQLLSKLESKAEFGIRKVNELREKLAGYFGDYHSFMLDPEIGQKLDRKKIDELEKYFYNSLTFDEVSNLDELYEKYTEIERYLREEFGSIASAYLSNYISYSYDFINPSACMNFSKARILLSVRNPSSVAFSNVTLTKVIRLNSDLPNPLVFRIDSIAPGAIVYKEYLANVFYNCSENYSVNRTQIEKRFFDVNNRLSQLCLFRECSELKKLYREAYSRLEPALVEEAVSEEISNFLSNFTSKGIKKRLDDIGLSLKEFEKAVDSKVSFEHNVSLLYSSRDYSQAYSEYARLKAVYDFLTPISLSSKPVEDRFEELTAKFSPAEIIDYSDNLAALESYINSSISSLKDSAKASLLLAKQNAEGSKSGFSDLKKALDYYNTGSYNKAILFASLVPLRAEKGFDLTYIVYAAIALTLALFCAFLIRKPKNERKIARRLLHSD